MAFAPEQVNEALADCCSAAQLEEVVILSTCNRTEIYALAPARTVLAGSSMGGWVCAQTSESQPVLGCFLLAPALAMAKYPQSSPKVGARYCQIIHGWDDEVVPVMPVLQLAHEQGLPALALPDGHRLENSLERVLEEFRWFLKHCRANLNTD